MNLYDNWNNFIPTITIILTIVIALATIWYVRIAAKTLREIKLQRETTYLPEIIINSTLFYLQCDNKYGFPIQYSQDSDISIPSINTIIRFLAIPIKVYNIGLGTAKKIQYKFEFDIKSAIAILQNKKIFLKWWY